MIRNPKGQVLLLQVNPAQLQEDGREYWDLPGGRVKKNQTILETLEREVAEETGITSIEASKSVGMVVSNIRIPLGNGVGLFWMFMNVML